MLCRKSKIWFKSIQIFKCCEIYKFCHMDYKELVKVYEELEKTSKRLEKRDIITRLLKEVKEEELDKVIYLLQGRVFANFDERKIGMSSRLILKVISKVSGETVNEVERQWKKIGDLGEVTS